MELKKDIFEGITAEPREHYTVQIDPASVAPVEKKYIGKLIKRMIIGILCGVILLFFGFASVFYLGMGFAIVLFMSASHIAVISNTKKQYAKAEERYLHTVYDYTLYDDFLIVCLSSDTGIKQMKYRLQELVRVEAVGSLVTLEIDGQLFFINRDALAENSYFLSRYEKKEHHESANVRAIRFFLTFFLSWVGSLIINHTNLKPGGYTSRTGAYLIFGMLTGGVYTLVASISNLTFLPTKPKNIGYKKDEIK